MKFVILTTHGETIVEAEDFAKALENVYDDKTGYDDIMGIIKLNNEVK